MANVDIQSFINFSQTQKGLSRNSVETARDYKVYLKTGNVSQVSLNNESKDQIRNQYISAIEYVLLNFTTENEKKYIEGLDLTNNSNLSQVIPLVAQKLKSISLYIAKERERAKFSPIKYNLKGSELGVDIYSKNLIYTLYNDIDFTSRFTNFPSISGLNYLNTSILYYYNSGEDFYDKDYKRGMEDPELYNGGEYENLNLLYFNKDLYFPSLSGNVIKHFNSFNKNYLLTASGSRLYTRNKQNLLRKYISSNIQELDTKYFLYGEKTENNLIFNIIKKGIVGAREELGSNKFLGTSLYYVNSANTSSPLSGLLVEASKRFSNILNYRNFTLQAIPTYTSLRSVKQIGGFFLPFKQGLGISISKGYSYTINTNLSGLNVTVDPNKAINPRGNSKTSYPNVFNYEENPGWIVDNIAGGYNWGKIKQIKEFQKFNGYYSFEENNFEYKSGINKTIESFDFFEGVEKSVWSNSDVFPSKIPNTLPLQERENSYNVGKDDIFRWQGDIYGNNYALYKTFNNYDEPKQYNTSYNSVSARNLNNFQPLTGVITASDKIAYLYRQSKYETEVQQLLTTKLYNTIDEKTVSFGEIKVKTFNNTETVTLTAAFSAVFSKYPTATKQEINNKVKTFHIIEDVIIIKTENYKIMEKFVFNINTDSFEPFFPFKTNLQ